MLVVPLQDLLGGELLSTLVQRDSGLSVRDALRLDSIVRRSGPIESSAVPLVPALSARGTFQGHAKTVVCDASALSHLARASPLRVLVDRGSELVSALCVRCRHSLP